MERVPNRSTRLRASPAMASAWRRRPVCTVTGDETASAVLLAIDGRAALIATTLRALPGSEIALHHPDAGTIVAAVIGGDPSRLRLGLAGDAAAVGFALAATAADMSYVD